MRSLVVLLVAVACCGMTSALPTRQRRSLLPEGMPLPDGVPLEMLFASCGEGAAETDIGPCLEKLLQGVIDLAKPSFDTGFEFGGNTIVLEPFALKDIEPKASGRKKKVQISGKNIQVSGIKSLRVQDVSLLPDEVALTLNFTQLNASGDLTAKYLFFMANAKLLLTLNNVSFHVRSNWELGLLDDKIAISLRNVTVDVDIGSFSSDISGLSGLGTFLKTFINTNNQLLLDLFEPKLEDAVKKLLEKEFQTIKLGRI